ncbi:MAG: Crp/Fnr family transcriptional regulator [Bacteroidota bacterium]
MELTQPEISNLKKVHYYLGNELIDEIIRHSVVADLKSDTEILKEGQYVNQIPLVLKGLIKVYSRYEDKELLLYYIQPDESCIMSFTAGIRNEQSKVYAVTEDPTRVLLLPMDRMPGWLRDHPAMNSLFFNQFNMRYAELLETIRYLLYHKLDKRIYDYLVEKSIMKGEKILNIRHKQIAYELGTAREVISRLLKKMEKEGKIRQLPEGIELL